jgi:two-component system, OmpR family, alkaline phosphatase synthesis response regulator PhoP
MSKILLVDDDKIVSRLIESLLQRKGYSMSSLADGRVASNFINDSKDLPDLVLLDLMLPFVDGFELLNLIRKNLLWKDVPVIMISSKGQEKNIVRAFELGADDYIVKPFSREEVAIRIKRQLRNL